MLMEIADPCCRLYISLLLCEFDIYSMTSHFALVDLIWYEIIGLVYPRFSREEYQPQNDGGTNLLFNQIVLKNSWKWIILDLEGNIQNFTMLIRLSLNCPIVFLFVSES